jgi:hypothetical protein
MATETFLVLDIDKCQKLRLLPGEREYQNTKEGSRYFGKTYRTILYAGKAFTIPSEDTFIKDLEDDNLFEVELEPTDEGYNFVGHRSITRAVKAHTAKVDMKAYTVEFVQTTKTYNPEDLATL